MSDSSDCSVFPLNRWINAKDTLSIAEFDSYLPCDAVDPEQRAEELGIKREDYMLSGKILGAPPQVSIGWRC